MKKPIQIHKSAQAIIDELSRYTWVPPRKGYPQFWEEFKGKWEFEGESMFKKGDKVVVQPGDPLAGRTLTVKSGPKGPCRGGNYYFEETDEVVLGYFLKLKEKDMSEFKVGDRVKVIASTLAGHPHPNTQDTVGKTGVIVSITSGEYPYDVKFDFRSTSVAYVASDLRLVVKTLETLQVGDTVTRTRFGESDVFTVEAVFGRVYVGVNDSGAVLYTAEELEDEDYELPVVEEEVKEMTVSEVEALVGKKVKIVK
jgi:ribosomal protein L21E